MLSIIHPSSAVGCGAGADAEAGAAVARRAADTAKATTLLVIERTSVTPAMFLVLVQRHPAIE
jgi:hypothetical protein